MSPSEYKWGIHLPTAALFIGWFSVIVNVIEIIYLLALLLDVPIIARAMARQSATNKEVVVQDLRTILYSTICTYLAFVMIDFVASVLLILGANKKYHLYLLPWLINNALLIAFKFVSTLFLVIAWLVQGHEALTGCGYFIFNVSLIALHFWLWYLVYLLYIFFRDSD